MSQVQPDAGKDYIQTGKDGQINAFWIDDFMYSALGKFILFRLLNNRDVKIVITGSGKSTGTGKTTLAIILAKWINAVRNDIFNMNKEWHAKDYAFMDVWDYLEKYDNSDKGDCLITDELEFMSDRRRHMTHENVRFSQAWSVLRYKNVVTIGTCPHLSDVDKRIPEGADVWINVTQKGRANVYYLTMDDFEWSMEQKRFKMFGFRETILWGSIDDSDSYQWLEDQKREIGVPGLDEKKNEVTEEDVKQKESEIRREATIRLLERVENDEINITQSDIGEIVGFSQPNVAKIKREEL